MKFRPFLLTAACLFTGFFLVPLPLIHAEAGPTRTGADVVPEKVPQKAIAFDLNQVQLLDSAFKTAQDLNQKGLLAQDLDVMLYPFRREAKLPSPVQGNDNISYQYTGHIMGHWMSAAAFMIRNTGDAELKKKAELAVAELAKCQDARGDGFSGGFPPERIFDLQTGRGAGAGVPWYCLHKIYAGLLDLYVLTDNKQALDVLKKAADWAIKYTDPFTEQQMQQMLGIEHGGVNETFANLYAVTGEEKYLKLAERFHHKAILDPFITGQDSLENRHANTQFPKFIGMARLYELGGKPDDNKIATNFWNTVVHERSYVTGGNSIGELFSPKATLSQSVGINIPATPPPTTRGGRQPGANTTETCNEFNMLRLTRILYGQDPKPEYADYFERTLYNQILSTRNLENGGQLYFQQLQSGRAKGPWLLTNRATQCCYGSGLESNAKYADGIYYHSPDNTTLFVNLFVPSVLNWRDKGVTLRQETRYPEEGATRLTINGNTNFTLNIRRPWWATGGFAITINGEKQPDAGTPGSYVSLRRPWKTGDVIQVDMPMSFRMEGFRDNPKRAAVMYGPLVMAAVTEPNNRTSAIVTQETPERFLAALRPVAGKPLEFTAPAALFRTAATPAGPTVTFKPLLRMVDESYAIYWDQMTPAEFASQPPAAATTAPAGR